MPIYFRFFFSRDVLFEQFWVHNYVLIYVTVICSKFVEIDLVVPAQRDFNVINVFLQFHYYLCLEKGRIPNLNQIVQWF